MLNLKSIAPMQSFYDTRDKSYNAPFPLGNYPFNSLYAPLINGREDVDNKGNNCHDDKYSNDFVQHNVLF